MTLADLEILIPLLGGQIVLVIQAWRNNTHASNRGVETLRQVTPPSNGHTTGQLLESIVNASTIGAVEATRTRIAVAPHEDAPEPPIPSADIPDPITNAQTAPTATEA